MCVCVCSDPSVRLIRLDRTVPDWTSEKNMHLVIFCVCVCVCVCLSAHLGWTDRTGSCFGIIRVIMFLFNCITLPLHIHTLIHPSVCLIRPDRIESHQSDRITPICLSYQTRSDRMLACLLACLLACYHSRKPIRQGRQAI